MPMVIRLEIDHYRMILMSLWIIQRMPVLSVGLSAWQLEVQLAKSVAKLADLFQAASATKCISIRMNQGHVPSRNH
jgi:hypothetical protein